MKKYLKDIGTFAILIGALFYIWDTRSIADDGKDQSTINQQTILELSRLANKVGSQLDLMLKLGAITKQTYEDLRMMPTKPQDENGNDNPEWYLVGDEAIYLIQIPDSCDASVHKIPFGGG